MPTAQISTQKASGSFSPVQRREQFLRDFEETWMRTEALFSALASDEAFFVKPIHGLRFPLAFYYGHAAVFYINKLLLAEILTAPLNAEFEKVFAVGVDEHSWDDLSSAEGSLPDLNVIREYRIQVYELVRNTIRDSNKLGLDDFAPIDEEHPAWALLMAIEHERVHLETSSMLMRELPIEHVRPPVQWLAPLHPSALTNGDVANGTPQAGRDYPSPQWIEVPGREVHLGRPPSSATTDNFPDQSKWVYGWDCEFGNSTRPNESFEVSRFLVSNGEFFAFVESGGYQTKSVWSEEGWQWKEFRKLQHPMFWVKASGNMGSWKLRTCFEEIAMPWSWPVIANFHEAKAFANWCTQKQAESDHAASTQATAKLVRLITEGEHHVLRRAMDPVGGLPSESANLSLRYLSETPVDREIHESSHLICDVFGNVWQWCEDIFLPLTGFQPHSLYPDYSTPSFDGRHQVLLGGCFMSTGDAAGPWNRNNFRRHFYQHAGIRLVRK